MKIAIGSDHAGFPLQGGKSKKYLQTAGHEVIDKGAPEYDPADSYVRLRAGGG